MKHIYKNFIGLCVCALFVAVFMGCEKDANFKMYQYSMPVVESISPGVGYVKTPLLITGTNFGNQSEPVKVFFGGVEADTVLMCKNNRIVVEVPENAVSGEVSLQIWTNVIENIGTFTVLPTPMVRSVFSENSLGSNIAAAGEKVYIQGSGFGTDPETVKVSFNGTPAEFTLQDDENIVAIAPQDYASGSVLVTVNGLEIVGDAMLNPSSKGDVTIFYFKNYKRPFIQKDYVEGQQGDRNMATPVDWIVNDAAQCYVNKNADPAKGKVGGMFPKTNALGMQVGWGGSGSATSITNGKMYQTTTLPKGEYQLEVSYVECNAANKATIVLMTGNQELPDFDKVETSTPLAFCYFTRNDASADNPGVETLNFTLNEQTEVTFGFVATFGNNTYFKISDIKLMLK